jgi:hypothetical protein
LHIKVHFFDEKSQELKEEAAKQQELLGKTEERPKSADNTVLTNTTAENPQEVIIPKILFSILLSFFLYLEI